jgi:hypothetical protein
MKNTDLQIIQNAIDDVINLQTIIWDDGQSGESYKSNHLNKSEIHEDRIHTYKSLNILKKFFIENPQIEIKYQKLLELALLIHDLPKAIFVEEFLEKLIKYLNTKYKNLNYRTIKDNYIRMIKNRNYEIYADVFQMHLSDFQKKNQKIIYHSFIGAVTAEFLIKTQSYEHDSINQISKNDIEFIFQTVINHHYPPNFFIKMISKYLIDLDLYNGTSNDLESLIYLAIEENSSDNNLLINNKLLKNNAGNIIQTLVPVTLGPNYDRYRIKPNLQNLVRHADSLDMIDAKKTILFQISNNLEDTVEESIAQALSCSIENSIFILAADNSLRNDVKERYKQMVLAISNYFQDKYIYVPDFYADIEKDLLLLFNMMENKLNNKPNNNRYSDNLDIIDEFRSKITNYIINLKPKNEWIVI